MSCSEVMYQAYYPYLYQRAAAGAAAAPPPVSRGAPPFASPFGPTAAHQYDRFNVQRLQEAHPSLSQQAGGAGGAALEAAAAAAAAAGHPALSAHPLYLSAGGGIGAGAGSVHSSGGSASPASPPPLRVAAPSAAAAKEERQECRAAVDDGVGDDDDSQDGDGGSRAQYVSANCVVFTHYRGDASAVVDEHFSRALDKTTHPKESSPMSTRNFPASFWNSDAYAGGASSGGHHVASADLYSDHYHPGAAESAAWYHQYSQHHRAVHDYHHHNMAAQYGGLLLPGSRLHMGSHAPCKAMDWQHPGIESAYSSYPTMSGLEAQVQDSSKEVYWF